MTLITCSLTDLSYSTILCAIDFYSDQLALTWHCLTEPDMARTVVGLLILCTLWSVFIPGNYFYTVTGTCTQSFIPGFYCDFTPTLPELFYLYFSSQNPISTSLRCVGGNRHYLANGNGTMITTTDHSLKYTHIAT